MLVAGQYYAHFHCSAQQLPNDSARSLHKGLTLQLLPVVVCQIPRCWVLPGHAPPAAIAIPCCSFCCPVYLTDETQQVNTARQPPSVLIP